jgi:hypothetical protein
VKNEKMKCDNKIELIELRIAEKIIKLKELEHKKTSNNLLLDSCQKEEVKCSGLLASCENEFAIFHDKGICRFSSTFGPDTTLLIGDFVEKYSPDVSEYFSCEKKIAFYETKLKRVESIIKELEAEVDKIPFEMCNARLKECFAKYSSCDKDYNQA